MISTYSSHPTAFQQRELRLMDLQARQAADYMEEDVQKNNCAFGNTFFSHASWAVAVVDAEDATWRTSVLRQRLLATCNSAV